jgi:hypothetical protein
VELGIEKAMRLPTLQDPEIWRVRVQVWPINSLPYARLTKIFKIGHERDVVFAVNQNAIMLNTSARILSVFEQEFIRGSIYVEAWTFDHVHRVLQGIGRVVRSRDGLCAKLVPLHDRIPILQMTDDHKFRSIHRMSWVRITQRGKYRNRLAVVEDADVENFVAHVLVICPAKRSRKRKMTPNTERGDQLVALDLPLARLTDRYITATEHELDRFRRSGNDFVMQALGTCVVPLRVGNNIEVHAGSLAGLEGCITEIHQDNTISFELHGADHDHANPVRVRASEVRKKFRQSDFVQIVHGGHKGLEGFIVRIDDDCAVISNPWQWDGEVRSNHRKNRLLTLLASARSQRSPHQQLAIKQCTTRCHTGACRGKVDSDKLYRRNCAYG